MLLHPQKMAHTHAVILSLILAWQKSTCSTCRNLLPCCHHCVTARLHRYTGCPHEQGIPVRCGPASTSPSPENGTYACGDAANARAPSLPASHNIWKRRGKEKKTTKSRQALRIQSGPSVDHKNHFLPKPLLRQKQTLLSFIKNHFLPKPLLRQKQILLSRNRARLTTIHLFIWTARARKFKSQKNMTTAKIPSKICLRAALRASLTHLSTHPLGGRRQPELQPWRRAASP